MRVSAVQFKAVKGNTQRALVELVALTDSIASGCDLVVLPEMAATGYLFSSPQDIAPVAESQEGLTFQALAPVAKSHGCWIVVGYPEVCGDLFYNSALIINPLGQLHFNYRKTLLYDADLPWATPGDSGYCRVETANGSFGVGICMDLNDNAFIEWCSQASLRVVALPTNWIQEVGDVWSYWAWRMLDVPSALVAANTYGPEGEIVFSGRSAVLEGRLLYASAPNSGNAVIVTDLP